MFSLEGKKALVTGATGGIGADIARLLVKQGAQVVVTGTRVEPLEALQKELGDQAIAIAANLGSAEDITRLATDAVEKLGQIDILVNNAGLTRDGLVLRMSDEDWDTVFDVNLKSSFRLTRALLRGMMKNRFGRIINMSSVVGVTGNAGQVNYAASKAAMIGMTKSLAQEVASRGITVNAIAPGFIQTAMTSVLSDTVQEQINGTIPMKRMGRSEEIASAVVYLASEESSYVTGQTLHVNGGMAMF